MEVYLGMGKYISGGHNMVTIWKLIERRIFQLLQINSWTEIICIVYEVDPLICPKCDGEMRVVAFIKDYRIIDKIIKHLKLTFIGERLPPPQAQPQLAMAAEERAEYL